MGGGWAGYVFSMFGCVLLLALVAGSTLLLYGLARFKKSQRPEPRVVVQSVSSRAERP